MPKPLTYKEAGVDIDASDAFARAIQEELSRTASDFVLDNPLGFAGLYALKDGRGLFQKKYTDPVLVSSTDGVGTKLKIAFMLDKHDTVGVDLVAMCVNDILTQGAKPLFFLDYIATQEANQDRMYQIVKGISDGCLQAGCSLLGGENAILPDMYKKGEYDLAGFVVGVVERSKLITGMNICPGDRLVALPSSGLHSNGYTLVRKIVFEVAGLHLNQHIDELACTLGEELLRPTRIYAKPILSVLDNYKVKKVVRGIAHITGGGIPGNLARILPPNCRAIVEKRALNTQPIFHFVQRLGNVEEEEMFRVFNMGAGLILVVSPFYVNKVIEILKHQGEEPRVIGEITPGTKQVLII